MHNTLAIARRELTSYFHSPVAHVVLAVFLVVSGWLFFYFSGLLIVGKASMRGFFALCPLLFMLFVPAITMRLIAEERKSGTFEGLMTLPVAEHEVVLGKFLAALSMMCVGLLCTFVYPVSLALIKAPGSALDMGPIIGGYLSAVLLLSSFIAFGMWASALSKNQIIAFILGLLLCFALWIPDKAILILPASLGAAVQYLSVNYHFENIARGVIDVRDVLYYLTVTTIGLVLTTRTIAATRQ
ncbi:MAG: ABC transporter permease subunit [Deltaproteobacteria bacterium]|nr:ABC transporter permease subunit [Deltaproteobacteria bacterium]